MRFSHTFIERPRLAAVVSGIIVIFGMLAFFSLPVSQYPDIAPPQIQVTASYPGASASTIAETVATPLEQAINGVESMLYISSQSTNDGQLTISVTFEPGTNLDMAQVLVQNRVSSVLQRLPDSVRQLGVTTNKNSPDMLMVINLFSATGAYDQTEIGNYAVLNIIDKIARLDGVGSVRLFGASEYAMRIWIEPGRLSHFGLTGTDVVNAIRQQNIQVSSGVLNQRPAEQQDAFEISVQTQGRLVTQEEFENIIIKDTQGSGLVRISDVGYVKLGAQAYTTKGYLGKNPSVALPITMRPGANALETADRVTSLMDELSAGFPAGIESKVVYNPTNYIEQSMNEVYVTLLQTIALVVIVILVFLQSWRTALIPIIAIPVSLIGTFALMLMFGFSLNMLSLFGLVLAIGIVVDDAIVVVENVERRIREGQEPIQAAKDTMTEVGFALVATSLVVVAVFIPTLLMEGISGQFYKQFGVTIAAATMLSTIVSLTLSPAMASRLMKPAKNPSKQNGIGQKFNLFIDNTANQYQKLINKLLRIGVIVGAVYGVLIAAMGFQLSNIPTGFIPEQDQGYAIVGIQLPSGASLERTDEVMQKVIDGLLSIEDIENTVAFTGFSGATFTNSSNAGAIFATFKPFGERRDVNSIIADMRASVSAINNAFVVVIPPPPVNGIGNAGGFKLMVQDIDGRGAAALEQATWGLAMAANQSGKVDAAFTFFETSTPSSYLDIDRDRALRLGVPMQNVFDTLQTLIGSQYINDFNLSGRTYRVMIQADYEYRRDINDLLRLTVRNNSGDMVPLGSIATVVDTTGPARVPRYNLYPAAALTGNVNPAYSSGEALSEMEKLASEALPNGFGAEWTELAYQERTQGNTAIIAFALAVLFVFMLLTAQYESTSLPLAIILIVPMCLLSAGLGLVVMQMDNNVLTQVGLVVLIGLAAKNAIMIVEFARQREEEGNSTKDSAEFAAKTRLRPILMTSLSFIFGVIPLLVATGPGAEMRQAIGLTVFSGMLGVTLFGLLFTPSFYVFCRKLSKKKSGVQQ